MKRNGFTLIELLVVIGIIGILASIIIPSLSSSRAIGRDSKRITDLKIIQVALSNYFSENNKYPFTLPELVPTYLNVMPKDPVTNKDYYYAPLSYVPNVSTTAGNTANNYHLGATLETANAVLNDDLDPMVSGGTGSTETISGQTFAYKLPITYASGDPNSPFPSPFTFDFDGGHSACGETNGADHCYDVEP